MNIISYKNPWAYLKQPRVPFQANAFLKREPSICRSRGGLVLHSANLRSTVFVADTNEADKIVRLFSKASSLKARNVLVDSYFS